jgi:hypothetical protein
MAKIASKTELNKKRYLRSGRNTLSTENTFGNYLNKNNPAAKMLSGSGGSGQKLKKSKVLSKKRKIKHSNSNSSSIGNKNFNNMLKDIKRFNKQTIQRNSSNSKLSNLGSPHRSKNVSITSSSKLFNNQFEGYFNKNSTQKGSPGLKKSSKIASKPDIFRYNRYNASKSKSRLFAKDKHRKFSK